MNTKIYIPGGAGLIIGKLRDAGFEAVIVGGCVRDGLLGRAAGDYDIATSAMPDETAAVFRKYTVVPTGIRHGTMTVVIDKVPYEVTTYRVDGEYTDGRRPDSVTFTPNLYEDLRRRDFTVNALAYSEETGLIDHFGGADDIKNKIIRCVGDARGRFSEDYLRMLRAYRFAAVLGFEIDAETLAAVKMLKGNVTGVSAERIRIEFDKLLMSGNFDVTELFMDEFADIIAPEIKPAFDVLRRTGDALCQRVSALFHGYGADKAEKAAGAFMRRLKYDNNSISAVKSVISSRAFAYIPEKRAMKNLLRRYGEETARHCAAYFSAGSDANAVTAAECVEVINQIITNGEAYKTAHLAVNGADVIGVGIEAGREVGAVLEWLTDMVIEGKVNNEKGELIKTILDIYEKK